MEIQHISKFWAAADIVVWVG